MKLGAGIFWLLVVLLFGGAAYFGYHVLAMMEAGAASQGAGEAEGQGQQP